MATDGNRPNGSGGFYGSSYHAVATENGGYVMVLGANCAPYAAPPLNQEWWHIVIPGTAQQSPEQWTDPVSRLYIKGVAKFIYDKHLIDGIPLKKVSGVELAAAGEKALRVGYCGHADVRDAFGQTDHYDPGPWFPWNLLAQEINALIPPPPPPPPPPPVPPITLEIDVTIIAKWVDTPNRWIAINGAGWRWLTSIPEADLLNAYKLAIYVGKDYPGAERVGDGGPERYVANLDRNNPYFGFLKAIPYTGA